MSLTYIIQKSRRRSLSVSITKDCKLLVKAPYGTTESYVRDFLTSKEDWILKHLEKQEEENKRVRELGFFTPEEVKEIKKQARKTILARVEYYAKMTGITYKRIALRLNGLMKTVKDAVQLESGSSRWKMKRHTQSVKNISFTEGKYETQSPTPHTFYRNSGAAGN